MTLGGLGVLDSPNSSGWPPMVCQGWAPMDQLSKSRTNTHPQQCHCLPAPGYRTVSFQLVTGLTPFCSQSHLFWLFQSWFKNYAFFLRRPLRNMTRTFHAKEFTQTSCAKFPSIGRWWTRMMRVHTCLAEYVTPYFKKITRILCHLVFYKQGKKTFWESVTTWLPALCLLPFQLDHARND